MENKGEDVRLTSLTPTSYGSIVDSDQFAEDEQKLKKRVAFKDDEEDQVQGGKESEGGSDLEDPSLIFEKKDLWMGDLFNPTYRFEKGEDGVFAYTRITNSKNLGSPSFSSPADSTHSIQQPWMPREIKRPSILEGFCGIDPRVDWEFSLPYLIIFGTLCGLISAAIDYTIDYLQLGTYQQRYSKF